MLPPSRIVYPVKPKARRPFPKRIALALGVFGALIVLGGGLWYVANLPYLAVDRLEVRGASLLPPAEIEAAVHESIAGRGRWGFIPRSNFFAVSGKAIEYLLRQRFPSIEQVDVGRRFPDRLVIEIKERTLWGVYCSRGDSNEPPGSCAYLDTSGTAYAELSQFQGWLLPVVFGSGSVALGTAPIPPATLAFFGQARAALAAVGGDLLAMRLSTSTPADARLELAEGWELWVNTGRPTSEWSSALETVLEQEIGARRPLLEYVDLRLGNKVFYKYR